MKITRVKSVIKKVFKYTHLKYKWLTCEEILVLGDSHAAVFKHRLFSSYFPNHIFNVVCVGGATVSGLENPNSTTQALPIFLRSINSSKSKKIIVLLGEVDTGFVIWYRAEKYKSKLYKMVEKALRNYQEFLLELSRYHQVICISTPLPTIKDGQDWGEIANARKYVRATQRQRTRLTIDFNTCMHNFCEKNSILWLSFDEESIGQNGIVDSRLLNLDPNNHHYEMGAYAEMIVHKLKQIIDPGDYCH